MFKKAIKEKLRFKTVKGMIGVEDLFDLPLKSADKFNLNEIAKTIYSELKSESEIDFVGTSSTEDTTNNLKLEIVKEIIKDKKEEIESKEIDLANKTHNEKIDELIRKKKEAELENLDIETLMKMKK